MDSEDKIRLFGLSLSTLERDLDRVEVQAKVDLGRDQVVDRDEDYYPQFGQSLRDEAAKMSQHYELFYCLEKSIRQLVAESLRAQHGDKWWSTCVPEPIRRSAEQNMKRELDSGITSRSEEEIDFTTFGELGEIVRNQWTSFGAMFSSEKAFTRIMASLNVLRGPIAHCCPLAEDEVVRLKLTLRDWFRLME